MGQGKESTTTFAVTSSVMDEKRGLHEPMPAPYDDGRYNQPSSGGNLGLPINPYDRSLTPTLPFGQEQSQGLLGNAAPMGGQGGYGGNGYGQGGYGGGYRGAY